MGEATVHPGWAERLSLAASGAGGATALITETGESVSYRELGRLLAQAQELLAWPGKALVAVFCERDLSGIIAYLACLSAGHACAFLGGLPAARDSHVGAYQPEFVVSPQTAGGNLQPGYGVAGSLPGGAVVQRRLAGPAGFIAPELALLLATSGSTGSPVLVRLSYRNLAANSSAVVEALGIDASHRAITSLPLSHCYGLSVLNTHLVAGASVVICAAGVLGQRFWRAVAEHDVTTFAGVPASYEMLRAQGFRLDQLPRLTRLQCSGGAVQQEVVRYFATHAGGRRPRLFWMMYGQTEATGRISCLRPTEWVERTGSVGRVIPGGQLSIVAEDGSALPDGAVGMVMYRGPSVMLGYARSRSDLSLPDVTGGTLASGDLGYLQDGYLYLTGRLKRIVKVLGRRIELDEVERAFADVGGAVAVHGGGEAVAVLVRQHQRGHEEVRRRLLQALRLPPAALIVAEIGDMPLTRSGKPDYPALSALARTLSLGGRSAPAAGGAATPHPGLPQ